MVITTAAGQASIVYGLKDELFGHVYSALRARIPLVRRLQQQADKYDFGVSWR